MGVVPFEIQLKETGPGVFWSLWKIHEGRGSGIFTLEWEKYKKQIVFRGGVPVASASNWAQEAFGQFLVRHGRITATQLQEALKVVQSQKLGDALVQGGLLQFNEMPQLLEEHFRERLFNLLKLSHGKLSFQVIDVTPSETTMLTEPFAKLLWEASKNAFEPQVCRSRLMGHLHKPAMAFGQFPLPLSPAELRVWTDLCRVPRVVSTVDGLGLILLAIAHEFGLIEWKESDLERFEKELSGLDKSFAKATYYQILKVDEKATSDECRKAYLELVKKYHPDRLSQEASTRAREIAQSVFAKINEAHSTLVDATKRKEYDAGLRIQDEGGMERVEAHLQAEMNLPQAKAALRRRHFKAAFDLFKEIIKSLTTDGEVIADYAYAELMTMAESKQDVALHATRLRTEFKKALDISPRYAASHYYLGVLLKLEGNFDGALKEFDQAMAMDPKLTEAVSEARFLRMRKTKGKSGSLFGKKSS